MKFATKKPSPDNCKYHMMNDKTIYPGVQTNMVCVDDRSEENWELYEEGAFATLYLGKVLLTTSRIGIPTPSYIPSQITKDIFEDLNAFWLNEPNPHCQPRGREGYRMAIPVDIPIFDIKYFKSLFYRSPKNVVLTKDQIISYFTRLHEMNVTLI